MNKINKMEAARRQLNAAIRCFFAKEDNLAIFNLASDVFMITENLEKKATTPSKKTVFSFIKEVSTSEEFEDFKNEMGKKPGYLKHANRDDGEINDVTDNEVLSSLCMATENFIAVFQETTKEMGAIKAYFVVTVVGLERAEARGMDKNYLELLKPYDAMFRNIGSSQLKDTFLNGLKSQKVFE